jgi:hypothetical protein
MPIKRSIRMVLDVQNFQVRFFVMIIILFSYTFYQRSFFNKG